MFKCTKNNSINTVHQFSTFLQLLTPVSLSLSHCGFFSFVSSILVLILISFTVRNRAAGISSGSNAEIIIRIGFKCLFWFCPLRTSRSIIDFNFIFMARYEYPLPVSLSLSLLVAVDIFFTLFFILFFILFFSSNSSEIHYCSDWATEMFVYIFVHSVLVVDVVIIAFFLDKMLKGAFAVAVTAVNSLLFFYFILFVLSLSVLIHPVFRYSLHLST